MASPRSPTVDVEDVPRRRYILRGFGTEVHAFCLIDRITKNGQKRVRRNLVIASPFVIVCCIDKPTYTEVIHLSNIDHVELQGRDALFVMKDHGSARDLRVTFISDPMNTHHFTKFLEVMDKLRKTYTGDDLRIDRQIVSEPVMSATKNPKKYRSDSPRQQMSPVRARSPERSQPASPPTEVKSDSAYAADRSPSQAAEMWSPQHRTVDTATEASPGQAGGMMSPESVTKSPAPLPQQQQPPSSQPPTPLQRPPSKATVCVPDRSASPTAEDGGSDGDSSDSYMSRFLNNWWDVEGVETFIPPSVVSPRPRVPPALRPPRPEAIDEWSQPTWLDLIFSQRRVD